MAVAGKCLLGSVISLDGFACAFQDALKQHATSQYNQLLYINMGSAVRQSAVTAAVGVYLAGRHRCSSLRRCSSVDAALWIDAAPL